MTTSVFSKGTRVRVSALRMAEYRAYYGDTLNGKLPNGINPGAVAALASDIGTVTISRPMNGCWLEKLDSGKTVTVKSRDLDLIAAPVSA
jgi:hypothetical protein